MTSDTAALHWQSPRNARQADEGQFIIKALQRIFQMSRAMSGIVVADVMIAANMQ